MYAASVEESIRVRGLFLLSCAKLLLALWHGVLSLSYISFQSMKITTLLDFHYFSPYCGYRSQSIETFAHSSFKANKKVFKLLCAIWTWDIALLWRRVRWMKELMASFCSLWKSKTVNKEQFKQLVHLWPHCWGIWTVNSFFFRLFFQNVLD